MSALGKLVVSLALEYAQYSKGLDKSSQEALGFAQNVQKSMDAAASVTKEFFGGMVAGAAGAAAAYVSFGAVVERMTASINKFDDLSKMSQKIGVASTQLQELAYVGDMSDVALEGLATGFKKLSANMVEAYEGGKEQSQLFKDIGVSVRDAGGKLRDSSDVMADVADVFAGMDDGAKKTALAIQIFGKAGADLIPALNGGKAAFQQAAEEAQRYGLVVAGDTLKAAEEFNDNLTRLGKITEGTFNQFAEASLPVLGAFSEAMVESASGTDSLNQQAQRLNKDGSLRDWATGAAKVLGFVADAGQGVYRVFEIVGKGMGALAAAAVAVLNRDFKGAGNILSNFSSDVDDILNRELFSTRLNAKLGEIGKAVAASETNKRKTGGGTSGGSPDGKAAATKISEYEKLTLAVEQHIATMQRQIDLGRELTATEKALIALDLDLAAGKLKLTPLQEETYRSLLKQKGAVDELFSSQQAMKKLGEELVAQGAKSVKALEDELEKQKEQIGVIGLSKREIDELAAKKLDLAAATDDESAANLRAAAVYAGPLHDAYLDYAAELEKAAMLKRELASGKREASDKSFAVEEAEKASAAWKKSSEQISDWLGDAFARGFGKGKDLWNSLLDSIKVAAARLVLNPIIQPIANFGASLLNPAAAQANGGGGTTFGSVTNLLSLGKTIWQGFSTGLAGSLAGIVETVGYALNSTTLVNFAAGIKGATATAGSAAAGAVGAGNFAASAIPIVGWIATALMAGKSFYESGYRASSNSLNFVGKYNPATQPHMVTDKFLQKLGMSEKGAAILSGSSGIVKLFGRKMPQVQNAGLELFANADGLDSRSREAYNIIEKGGVFRSDKRYTEYQGLGAELSQGLDSAIDAIISGARSYARTLGTSQDAFGAYNKAYEVPLTSDEAANQAAIDKMLNNVADDLAKIVLPNVEDFAVAEESAAQTLQRLMGNYATVDAVLTSIGKTLGSIGTGSIAAREKLIALSGGLEAFVAQSEFYAQNFLTEAERIAPVQKQVADTMAELGYASVDTKDEFKNLVNSLDLSSEAGQKLYAQLMAIAPAFVEVANYAEQAADKALTAAEKFAIAEKLRATALDGVSVALATVQRSVAAEQKALQTGHEATMEVLGEKLNSVNGRIEKLSSLSSVLRSTVDGMQLPSQLAASRLDASAQIDAAIAIAKAGGAFPTAESLSKALGTLSQPSEHLFSTSEEYQRDFLRNANKINELGNLTENQLSVEEHTRDLIQDQILEAERHFAAEMARLDGILTTAQADVDAVNGVNTSVLSVAQAIQNLAGSIASARAVGAGQTGASAGTAAIGSIADAYRTYLHRDPEAAGLDHYIDKVKSGAATISDVVSTIAHSPEAQVQQLYQSVLGRVGESAGVANWVAALNAGMSLHDAEAQFKNSAEYKLLHGIPALDVGTNYVTGDMLAMIHKGERVMPAADNEELMTRLSGSQELYESLLARLRAPAVSTGAGASDIAAAFSAMDKRLANIEANTGKTATSSGDTAVILNEAARGNLAITTEAKK